MRTLYFCPVFSSFFFFSSLNPGRRTLDVYHTSTHGVALVRTYNTGLKCTARGSLKYRTQKVAKISPSGHHHTTLWGYIFATKARIDNRKKLLNSSASWTCHRNRANFGPLTAEIVSGVWGTPANFNGVSRLGFVTVTTSFTGGNQTLHDVWPSPI